MQSIKTIYKIGPGPSSSHTFGPMMASKYINEQYPEATNFKITLFGSLALTGKGHLTDKIILKTLGASKCEIIFDMKTPVEHPNTMIIEVFDKNTKIACYFPLRILIYYIRIYWWWKNRNRWKKRKCRPRNLSTHKDG